MKEETVEAQLAYIPSKYSKALNLYTKTQVRVIVPFLNQISKTCDFSSQYPVCKVLKAVSRIFLLNQIEVIFLAYLIRQTRWDIKDKIIHSNGQNVQDIVCYSIESLDYKRIILYLMVASYTVKYYLNENNNEAMEEAIKRCSNFKKVFQSWAKKHSGVTTKINPRTLNSVYKQLYVNVRNQKPDFNTMVDAILQISPAYNPERDKANKEEKKKNQHKNTQNLQTNVIKQTQEPQKQPINKPQKQEKSAFIPNEPLFSSSAIMGLQQNNQEHHRKDSASGLNLFFSNKSGHHQYKSMLGSSLVRGLNGDVEIDGDVSDDCGQIMLNLRQGQSEENIYFDNDENANLLPSNASTVNLSNGLELTEKYLTPESKVGKKLSQ